RAETVAFGARRCLAAARGAPREPDRPEREVSGLAEALVGAAASLGGGAHATPGAAARQAAATLRNFAWAGLGNLMSGAVWSPPEEEGGDAGDGDEGGSRQAGRTSPVR